MVVFDKTWWIEHGPTYKSEVEAGKHGPAEAYEAQELKIIEVVGNLVIDSGVQSILEIGAGFGRITNLIEPLVRQRGEYIATDISAESLALINNQYVTTEVVDLDAMKSLAQADLVLAVEVLMHRTIGKALVDLTHMLQLAKKYVVVVGWWQPGFVGESPGCYQHDFVVSDDAPYTMERIDIPEARQAIWVFKKKVDNAKEEIV